MNLAKTAIQGPPGGLSRSCGLPVQYPGAAHPAVFRYRQPDPQHLGGLARVYQRYVAKIRLTGEGNPVLHIQNGDTASALPIFPPARR
ncbi:hypothetical protein DBR19_10370 [Aeromonas sp. HMWF014]|nr:hypothetical protein DBR19_10370 [Aeromonas sp. HMWF014]